MRRLKMVFSSAILRPGDCLLYSPYDFFGWLTCVKTWSRFCHVEVYVGDGQSVASRNGIGVNRYPLRTAQLSCVRRPAYPLNLGKATWWAQSCYGQKYDWLGLLCFTLAVKKGDPTKQFCSEFALRFYRAGGFEPFNPDCDADHTAPSEFLQTPALVTVWSDGGANG